MSGVNSADEWSLWVFFVKELLNKFTIFNVLAKVWLFFDKGKNVSFGH